MALKTVVIAEKMRQVAGYPQFEHTYRVLRELVITSLPRHEREVYRMIESGISLSAFDLAELKGCSTVSAATTLVHLLDFGLLERRKIKNNNRHSRSYFYTIDNGRKPFKGYKVPDQVGIMYLSKQN